MKLVFFLLAFLVGGIIADEFDDWKAKHNKTYHSPEEENNRKGIFAKNLDKIKTHNAAGIHSYTLAMNHLGDLTPAEVKKMRGYRQSSNRMEAPIYQDESRALPTSVDWRLKAGVVTPVKDQQQCGSCWTFSATGALEGQMMIKKNKSVSLSEQNLVDCVTTSYGCDGGWSQDCFTYVKSNGGLDTEASYPYTALDGTCKYNKAYSAATATGYVSVAYYNETALQSAVANVGPVSVAIDASADAFQFYSGGVYNPPGCSSTNLDHAVLVVGYGAINGTPVWYVKNSWSQWWVSSGYIYIARNANNACGIATDASYPTV